MLCRKGRAQTRHMYYGLQHRILNELASRNEPEQVCSTESSLARCRSKFSMTWLLRVNFSGQLYPAHCADELDHQDNYADDAANISIFDRVLCKVSLKSKAVDVVGLLNPVGIN